MLNFTEKSWKCGVIKKINSYKRRKGKAIAVQLFVSLLMFYQASSVAETLKFSVMQDRPIDLASARRVLAEAYSRIGISFEITTLPNKRSILVANEGLTDGELFRQKIGIEENFPNLKRIPVCIHTDELVVFTKSNKIPLTGWNSLSNYSVDFERGFRVVTDNMPSDVEKHSQRSVIQSFERLEIGRTDFVVDTRVHGMAAIKQLGFTDIQALEPPLKTFGSYHYLHVKNQHLIEPLTKVLHEMEQEGVLPITIHLDESSHLLF